MCVSVIYSWLDFGYCFPHITFSISTADNHFWGLNFQLSTRLCSLLSCKKHKRYTTTDLNEWDRTSSHGRINYVCKKISSQLSKAVLCFVILNPFSKTLYRLLINNLHAKINGNLSSAMWHFHANVNTKITGPWNKQSHKGCNVSS